MTDGLPTALISGAAPYPSVGDGGGSGWYRMVKAGTASWFKSVMTVLCWNTCKIDAEDESLERSFSYIVAGD